MWNTQIIGNLLKYMCAKNYRNRRSSYKAIAKIKVCSFFASHGIVWFNVPLDTF